jgi:hypothetical protein
VSSTYKWLTKKRIASEASSEPTVSEWAYISGTYDSPVRATASESVGPSSRHIHYVLLRVDHSS